jgi:urease accessory protein
MKDIAMEISKLQKACSTAFLATAAVALGSNTAFAHPTGGPVHDLLHGLEHPLTGVDHILAMIAVGLWASQRGGRALWLVPLTFVGVMTAGGALGISGYAIPYVEQGIVLSVLVLGVLVAAAVRLPLAATAAIVGLFAIAHGNAHAFELPASASVASYTFGFIAATTLLLDAGIAFGLVNQRVHTIRLVRIAGATIALCGIYLGLQ